MFSYEERLKTFIDKGWPTEGYKSTPHLLAISGFICKSTNNDLAAMCVYCKKHLEGWEKKDIPIIEHYDHKKDCILFSPHLIKTQKILIKDFENYKQGFIQYDLKSDSPFLFCYKCGSTDFDHICNITKRFKIDFKNPSEFFFINLISGLYENEVNLYVNKKILLPNELKDIFKDIIENSNPLISVEEFLNEYVNNSIKKVESFFDDDIKNIK